MKLNLNGYYVELFETERDYLDYLSNCVDDVSYHGKLYGIPKEFGIDLVEIKRLCFYNIEFVLVWEVEKDINLKTV